MQVIEVTVGGEAKRNGPRQYESDTRSAFVKLAVHPGDDVASVIAEGRRLVAEALADRPAPLGGILTPREPAARPWCVTITGVGIRAQTALRPFGFTWDSAKRVYVGDFPTELEARAKGHAATLAVTGATATEPTQGDA